jgi:uncharacterized protein YdiU (UPF0061 family)
MHKLNQLNFENTFARLPKSFHSRLNPTPLSSPYLVNFNAQAAQFIDLDVSEVHHPDFVDYFSGNINFPAADPLAMLYAGHQFGHFVPQLGDGRAILLGEVRNNQGELWDIQLKGAGITPYSRRGDGRAVLRSSIREYLCSEAMDGLGIPTSRALCITGSDDEVYREIIETASVLTRLSPSHIRFGSFEVFFYRGQYEEIKILADYVIARHFPALIDVDDKYLQLLNKIIQRTAKLMAQWQTVGFSHGVMNTDNMSILGLTFDYGPFGFMEAYDPGYICNHSDPQGRYAFDQQPQVGLWNLTCLAQALSPLISQDSAESLLESYAPEFYEHFTFMMGKKLGLSKATKNDMPLISELLEMMQASQLDYTNFFRHLGKYNSTVDADNSHLRNQFVDRSAFDTWEASYRARLLNEPDSDFERKVFMDRFNPKYILRNHLAQIAIEKAEKSRDFSEIDILLKLFERPFDEQPKMERYAALPPEWARKISVSCSS